MKKKTTIDKLAHKYALNIKQIRGPGPTKIADFKNLNKNFYDDIESNNIKIKGNTTLLKKIKNSSIKEFIYANREIPEIWRNNFNYQNDIINSISKDKKLLSYIGTSTIKTTKHSIERFPRINSRYDAASKLFSRNIEDNKSQKENNTMNQIYDTNININNNNHSLLNATVKHKKTYRINHSGEMNEKEVNSLLDDYKSAYPIKERLKELYATSNYYKLNLDKTNENKTALNDLNNTNNLEDCNKVLTTKSKFNSIDTVSASCPRQTFVGTKKKFNSKKQNCFKYNIYNNLSPKPENSTLFLSNDNTMINNGNKTISLLNLHKGNKNRKIKDNMKMDEIDNPIIKKNIESINFYGPYSAFCPYCRNKNIKYYNVLEPNHCLELIHFIKKIRHKNTIFNINNSGKNATLLDNQKTINKDSSESENEINSKNENVENEKIDKVL